MKLKNKMTIEDVIRESERFLREEVGAQKCRIVDILTFMNIVGKNNLRARVKSRDFTLNYLPHSQAYVELNGEYVYSTILVA